MAAQGQLVHRLVDPDASKPARMTEAEYRREMNGDAMATEKLAAGIRGFTGDQIRLEKILAEKL